MSDPPEPEAVVWEPEVLRTLSEQLDDVDGTMINQIVSRYVTQGRELVDRLRAAAEDPDAIELREVAHSLRGSTLAVGGARLAGLCRRIEYAERVADAQEAARTVGREFESLAEELSASLRSAARASGGPRPPG